MTKPASTPALTHRQVGNDLASLGRLERDDVITSDRAEAWRAALKEGTPAEQQAAHDNIAVKLKLYPEHTRTREKSYGGRSVRRRRRS
jgi:hypothetical protein